MPTKETIVSFSLWAVLGVMATAMIICVGYLGAEQKDTQTKQQTLSERITKTESQNDNINEKLNRLILVMDKIDGKIDDHQKVHQTFRSLKQVKEK